MTTVSIVIPWRDSGDAHRQANLSRVLDHLAPTELPLILADDGRESGPFNRSAAYNHGMRLAPAEVYVFHEADMLVPLVQLAEAVRMAHLTTGLVVPFDHYRYLGEEASRLALSGYPVSDLFPDRLMENGSAVGAVGVVSAASMEIVGGWDEAFEGHGYDDRAMHVAFAMTCGHTRFVEGGGTHLWHPPAYSPWERGTEASAAGNYPYAEVEATVRNRARLRRYRRATTPEQIRELTGSRA